jgi:hypothetical protein
VALTYFTNFSNTVYSNSVAVDITERVVVSNTTTSNPFLYYPLTLNEGIRPDNIAYAAYGDPYASWVLYLCNGIIDPYFDWYLSTDQFNSFIIDKYGSVPIAQQRIKYFINNWLDQSTITPAGYEALTANQQSYWQPNYTTSANPSSYSRANTDWTTTTNFVINVGVNGDTAKFIFDEVVNISQVSGNLNAQVLQSDPTFLILQHIQFPYGSSNGFSVANGSTVTGLQSGVSVTTTSFAIVSNNIPEDTQAYWAPLTYYDWENAKNEGNKIINVLQPQYLSNFVTMVKGLLQSNTPVV